VHLTLHLTRACNMRCRYCYAPPANGPVMSEAVAEAALRLGARINEGSCGIIFFGGEPLLAKPLIREVVGRARAMEAAGDGRFHFKITTNGLLLDEAFLEFACRERIIVAMSHDGVRAAHDAHRVAADGSPTFERTADRLRLLLAYKPYASVIMVVNPDTVVHMAAGVEFLLDAGVRYVILSLNYAGPWDEASMGELDRQYRRLGRLYVRWTRAGRKFYLSPFEVKLSSHINPDRCDIERCDLGSRQLSVDPEGFLYPCVQFTRSGPAGGWCVGSVFDGIDEPALARIRAESRQEKAACRGCVLQPRCAHTCACLNWQTTGSFTKLSPVLCRHEQMLLPIADRVGAILARRRDPLFIQKHYNPAYPVLSLLEDADPSSVPS
jgi:uncharacterized protein